MTDPTPSSSGGAPPPSGTTAAPAPGKADLGKRAIAFIIDAVIAIVVGFIPIVGGLVATVYWLLRDGLNIEFMDGRSIGKKLMKLRPVTEDGSPVDITVSIKRNWMFALVGLAQLLGFTIIGLILAIPLALVALVICIVEIVLVVTDPQGRRFGDKMAGTVVNEVSS